jgi:hypothetical protein
MLTAATRTKPKGSSCGTEERVKAFVVVVEAGLLLVFGLFGAAINLSSGLFIPLTVLLLCFIMGLQNALITKISNAEIRTTHVTGLVTDIGIELGKLLYFNGADAPTKIVANRRKLRIHLTLVGCFFIGRLTRDVGAGLTVGVVALPLAMAFAIASGLKPEAGLFTAIIAGFLISALGGSRVQIGGPAGAFIVIVYGIVERTAWPTSSSPPRCRACCCS